MLKFICCKSLKGGDVVEQLSQIKQEEMLVPTRIQCDNGSEFISKEVDRWAYENGVILDFSRPGKPTDTPYIESFNGKFRDECLNEYWFETLSQARVAINKWRKDYNEVRPHSSCGRIPPAIYAQRLRQAT